MGSAKLKAAATGAACVVVGATAGIVGASAAPASKPSKPQSVVPLARGPWRGLGPGRGPAAFGPAVHADVVVLNRAGTKFITVTEDSGTVQSVSGDALTIKEAVGKITYRTVTLTIPSGASVTRNFAKVTLSALKSGDRVRVVQSSDGTEVDDINPSALLGPGHGWGPGGRVRPGFVPRRGMLVPGAGGGPAGAPPLPQGGPASLAPVPQSGA